MIVDLGCGDQLVAVAESDTAAPPGLPVVGNYQAIDAEALLAVKPTVVVTMSDRHPVPRLLTEMAAQGRFELAVYPSPLQVEQVTQIIFDQEEPSTQPTPGYPCLGEVLGKPFEAFKLAARLQTQLRDLQRITEDAPKPRVLMVFNTRPMMACGPGTAHNQLLQYAGAINAAEAIGSGQAPTLDRELLLAAAPDVVLLLLPNAPPLGSIEEDSRLAELRGLDIPAVKHDRVVLIDDPLALLPSSCLVRIAAAMSKAIHPDLVDPIDQAMRVATTAREQPPLTTGEAGEVQWLTTQPDASVE